ncbi:MAG: AcvB/VirJ family lysyl-phosphatidylglycerol hydrolase [Rudaea sp.]|uniref:AcvB/VirJ family lysyl-phosphatidylglycerol hydrolase n=1 Tax=Rudaea sp. TaxID=2136325 RepID=UPI0039E5C46B
MLLLFFFHPSAEAGTVPVHYGLFGDVHVAAPADEAKRTVVFVSDKEGWNARSEALATALADDGALVFGIDYPVYEKAMESIRNDACHFPSAHIQEMSDWMQKNQKVKNFTYPLLVGDGAGAAFAYAVDAQAPKGTFGGLVTLGWDFSPRFPKPICKGDAGEMSVADDSRFRIAPVKALPNRWLPLPFAIGARVDGALSSWRALWNFLPLPPSWRGHPRADTGDELNRAVARLTAPASVAKPLPGDVADLPLVEVPAQGAFAERIAIILTGDGGWAGLDIAVADQLSKRGIVVVGLNTLKFFWQTRTPAAAADAVTRIVGHYGSEHPNADFVVIGYSFGASLAPVVVNRLPDAARARIAAQVLISPDDEAVFEIHVGDWFGSTHHDGAIPIGPEIAQSKVPVICVHGTDEGADSFCATLAGKPNVSDVSLPGGHHYDGDYDALCARIAASLSALGKGEH